MFKAIRYDLRFGIYEPRRQYLFVILLGLFVFVCLLFDAVHLSVLLTGSPGNLWTLPFSVGDVILIELGSSIPAAQQSAGTTGFSFPTIWFLSCIIPCYLTLNYTVHDLSGGGIQVLTRLQSRRRWWASKCILSTTAVMLYYIVLYAVIAILCLVFRFRLSFLPDETIFSAEFNAIFLPAEVSSLQMFSALCLMPCIVTAALSLVQMTLTLWMKPVFAYLVICAYLAGGVVFVSPFFLANYAMPVRSSAVGVYQFDFVPGLISSIAVALAAVGIGMRRIDNMDLLQGGKG